MILRRRRTSHPRASSVRSVRFGIMFANTMAWADADGAIEAAQAAERSGFDSVWTVEHVVYPDEYGSAYPYSADGRMPGRRSTPIPDPLIWLAFVASATERLRLGTGVLILPQRNPLVLAKELATLDALSGGRAEVGIGVGWLREEFEALGVPWARRGARTDEYVKAMRALWASDGASFDGEFASFHHVSSNPKPVRGMVPVIVGGHSEAAAKRAGRLGDGFFPGVGGPAELRRLVELAREAATEAGRDPDALEVTAGADGVSGRGGLFGDDPLASVQALADIGVRRIVVPAHALTRPSTAEGLAAFGERVIAPAAALG